MTDSEWRACASPARMRNAIRGRSFHWLRWMRFSLACVQRVRDLFDDARCLAVIDHLNTWVESEPAIRPFPYTFPDQPDVREAVRSLWTRRRDPLRGARIAAARALLSAGSLTLATSEMVCIAAGRRASQPGLEAACSAERAVHADLLRCLFRSTLEQVPFDASWRTSTVVALTRAVHESRDFFAMPILADALQDAGCDSDAILNHCRDPNTPHVRGCWVVDLVLGKT
jgi:hypothetical protein